MRFDFDTFVTITATTGACTDSMQITGNTFSSNATPNLCGTLSGQHCKYFCCVVKEFIDKLPMIFKKYTLKMDGPHLQ